MLITFSVNRSTRDATITAFFTFPGKALPQELKMNFYETSHSVGRWHKILTVFA